MNFFKIKEKMFPKKDDVQEPKTMGILDHLEKIIEISQKYGIEKCLVKAKKHLDYVTDKLGISPIQALLFSHFMERSDDNNIYVSEIASSIKCSKLKIIKYINDCDELEKKRLIRCKRENDNISFRVPRDVCDSLRKFNEFRPEKKDNLSIDQFFTHLERIFCERENDELTYDNMGAELLDLINQNMHLLFCKKIMSYRFANQELLFLICFCHLFGNNNDDNICGRDFKFLFENNTMYRMVKKELSDGSHVLISTKFIDYNDNDGFVNSESWKLSDKAKKDLLSEITVAKNFQKGLMPFEKIISKKLFYNERESEAIEKLVSLLQEENYGKIIDRLNNKGMRQGFACIFSGPPGTGKTETAYQIARLTKRHIMMVDIAETKSKWYGESEKKIKEIFDTYREAVEKSEIAPILLFNEADAVIGRRKEIGTVNGTIDQTENTIQNIILQEMENLCGILIATTNLTQNMDHAFERRFLYKINFEKPSLESRKNIWNTMLPELPEEKASNLAERFELSGGQIENIARKVEVDAIISGDDLCMQMLTQYCKDESLYGFTMSKKIGFGSE
ncbi:MAG: ATP-binding protein [Treponema sp.]|nr:ATP-binding protein [Treponema sp.]MCL2251666.1 ATP-binding protein [Treponema sp.]